MREGSPTHGSRRGLSSTAPIGAVEPFSQYGIYAMNFSYRTLGQFTIHNPGLPQHQVPSPWHLIPIHSSRRSGLFLPNIDVLSIYFNAFCPHHSQSVQQVGRKRPSCYLSTVH